MAIMTLDPGKLADFYEKVFEMKVLFRSPEPGGAVFMTDGYFNVALLPNKGNDTPSGINHFGWHVEDKEEIARRIEEFGLAAPTKRPSTRPYAEHRATDPDGNLFDLSEHGFQDVETDEDRARKGSQAGRAKQKVEA
jgi:catechol 2,3-dioxygenase-like lactoylglutathione lyase family enzyme